MSEESYHSTPPLLLWLFIHDILRLSFSFISTFNRPCLDARSIIVADNAIVYLFCHVVIEGLFSLLYIFSFLPFLLTAVNTFALTVAPSHLYNNNLLVIILFSTNRLNTKRQTCLDFKCNIDWKKK